jgi:MEDS: MEthanogen/methylotroph, DcmR Sensory domain
MTQTLEHGSFEEPGSHHLVQFYDAEPSVLVGNVAGFIDEGLERGDSVVVIATPEHGDAFLNALGKSRGQNETRTRRLVILDAQATLDQFMRHGAPDWRRFEQIVGGTIRGLRRANPAAGLRAYGEMVGILWAAGQVDAAVQLEKFWNVLLSGTGFTLFCGYPIDVFADEFHGAHIHDLLCAHTHVLPGGTASVMESALNRAVRDVLGEEAPDVRRGIDGAADPAWGALPGVEATILWLRNHQPKYAGEILSRARTYYRACA